MIFSVVARAWYRFSAPILVSLLAFGCYPPTKVPIDTLRYEAPAGLHDRLFVFLPGNGDKPSAFERHGFLKAVRDRGLPVDMIAVNAHLGYYMNGTIFTRLKEDVIDPAKARGYKKIWLIGNSLGGYGSLSYARQYPHDITGIVLLGPFLGDKNIIREIREAGGLQKWEPGAIGNSSQADWDKQLWKWMKDSQQQEEFWYWLKDCEGEKGCFPKIFLGYGKSDRFAYGQNLMAGILPQKHVVVVDGGHNWSTWKELWNIILDKMTSKKSAAHAQVAAE